MAYDYSPRNNALIQNQFQGAEAVASFKYWKDAGYSVNKGEKGIQILSFTPITRFKTADGKVKQLKDATKEEREKIKSGEIQTYKTKAFSKGHVFDISQTNAPIEDLPKIFPNRQYNFELEEGSNKEYLKKGIQVLAENVGIEIKDMKESMLGYRELGSAKGVFVENPITGQKEILLNSRNTETQSLGTSIHELAHAVIHNKESGNQNMDSPTKEFQAELVSYIVCKHYGMDTSEKAIPYIANWTRNGQEIQDKEAAIEGVHRTVKHFINVIDPVIAKEKELGLQMKGEKEMSEFISRFNEIVSLDALDESEKSPINHGDQVFSSNADFYGEIINIQENHGLSSNKMESSSAEFISSLKKNDPKDYLNYLTNKTLLECKEVDEDMNLYEPMLKIHGVTDRLEPFGSAVTRDLTPDKYAETEYTVVIPENNGELVAFSGSYNTGEYSNILHHVEENKLTDDASLIKLNNNYQTHSKDLFYHYDHLGRPFELEELIMMREKEASSQKNHEKDKESNEQARQAKRAAAFLRRNAMER